MFFWMQDMLMLQKLLVFPFTYSSQCLGREFWVFLFNLSSNILSLNLIERILSFFRGEGGRGTCLYTLMNWKFVKIEEKSVRFYLLTSVLNRQANMWISSSIGTCTSECWILGMSLVWARFLFFSHMNEPLNNFQWPICPFLFVVVGFSFPILLWTYWYGGA